MLQSDEGQNDFSNIKNTQLVDNKPYRKLNDNFLKSHGSMINYIQQKLTVSRPHVEAVIRAAGFIYTENNNNSVRCSECGIEISNLTKEMVPFDEHKSKSPLCPFVKKITCVDQQDGLLTDQSASPIGIKPLKLQKTETSACVVDATTQQNNNKRKQQKKEKCSSLSSFVAARGLSELETVRQVRRRTFSHWPNQIPSRNQMCKAGFFGCNVADRVYCNVICQQWIPHDDPIEIHKLLSPNCPYIKSLVRKTEQSNTVRIVNEIGNRQSSQTASATNTSSATDKNYILRCNEIVLTAACNISYIEIPKRFASFTAWPKDPLPSIDDLVKSGFYYTGTKTIVTCFYCNGSLQNWGEKDNPMIEHARWFPHCAYARQLCGDDLYTKIQKSKRAAQNRSSSNEQSRGFSISNINNSSNDGSTLLETNISNNRQLQIPDESTLSRLVSARLDLPISQNLLNKKVKLSVIKRCYEDQLRLKYDDFVSDCDLMMACTILQKQIDYIDGKKENIVIPNVYMKKLCENVEKERIVSEMASSANESCSSSCSTSSMEANSSKTNVENSKEKAQHQTSAIAHPCVLCLTDEKRLACIPCGHLATCVPCGHSLKTCPLCRRDIEAFVRVYI
ncbi:unnamed protein product [Didymodactylos carnosus]|uniref:RING-type domain-containing protein n=1 Tax=Didymodactylos carnosus TaxID=1234261 RepID=A0A815J3H9_9BILA|nr:unnamed protein product [Didymodactylos carnosus]CAF4262724.1 unnamed protein product [Didymodactylos carnosus]